MTEEEFKKEIFTLNNKLQNLNQENEQLYKEIEQNIKSFFGE